MAAEHDPAPRCADSAPPYGTIAFDCDSTLSAIEGIDELAAIAGVTRESVERLTAQAMAGELDSRSPRWITWRRCGARRWLLRAR